MSESAIVAVIIGVLTILTGSGFWGYRQFSKEAPVKKRDADIAAADTSVQMALAIAKSAKEHSEGLAKDLTTERGERQKLSGRVDGLESHIREQDKTILRLRDAIRVFTAAWDDLTHRWDYYRKSDHPPARPNVHIE